MVNRHNRLLVTFHVLSDAMLGVTAFIIAYELRFHSDLISRLIPITKGMPPLQQYLNVLPFIAVLVPFGFQLQGLYRLRRGRSRVDDFFAVFVGTILAVVFGIVATLYVQTYFATSAARQRGAFEVSQPVWAIFLAITQAYLARALERQGRIDEADVAATAAEHGAGGRVVPVIAYARMVRAKVAAQRGDALEAERLARAAAALAATTDLTHIHGEALENLAEILETSGRRDDARPLFEQAVQLFTAKGAPAYGRSARRSLKGSSTLSSTQLST